MEPEKLKALAIERDKAGFQLNFHAIGDRAIASRSTHRSRRQSNGRATPRSHRTRAVVALLTFRVSPAWQVIASMQPSHQTTDMRWAENRVGPTAIKGAYAWNSIQKFGARLAFGTDYDVEVINPFRGLYACVTRELPDGGPQVAGSRRKNLRRRLHPRLHFRLRLRRIHGRKKGELKAGELADFIVLSADLTKVPPSQFTKTTVLMTIVGGRTVYANIH